MVLVVGRLFLLTLGFHENFAIRRLTRNSTGRGDVVLLVSIADPAAAVLTAYDSVKGFGSRMGFVVKDLFTIDPGNLAESISTLLEDVKRIMDKYDLNDIIIDATGGVKPLAIATFILGLLLSKHYDVTYYIQSETSREYETMISREALILLSEGVTREEARILAGILENPGLSTSELSVRLGVNYKTLLNRLSRLKKLGLINQRGRGGTIYPTPWAKIAVYLYGGDVVGKAGG